MSDIIRLLPENVANQIAAGEVVQRPSSVVKELVENAVDAGALNITIHLKDAGRTLIQVIDDGHGMGPKDAELAFERHATSKIRTAEDLFDLSTNGFRGEALASIAAVAQVSLETRMEEESLGLIKKVNGGQAMASKPSQCAKGSNIQVKNLFFNVPARRNFLKSNAVEMKHSIQAVQRIAFTEPGISFQLIHNDQEVLHLKGSNENDRMAALRKRVVSIMGRNYNEKLVPIKEKTEILEVNGFVGKPDFAKKKRGEQYFFVNGRYVKHPYLHHAVLSAFEGLIPQGTHPSYFLFLEVPKQSLDVNIHPTKTEVKFDNERDLYAIIRSTVRHSLGQYNISPVLDFERDASLDTPYAFKDKTSTDQPRVQVDKSFNPFAQSSGAGYQRKPAGSWEALYLESEPERELIHNIAVEATDVSEELFDHKAKEAHGLHFQLLGKFIASPVKNGMVLIHQHRAHQRILYEEYLQRLTEEQQNQQSLLFPLELSLSQEQVVTAKSFAKELEEIGFGLEAWKKDGLSINAIPVWLEQKQVSGMIKDLIDNYAEDISQEGLSQTDRIAKSMAASTAVKTGELLNAQERESLIDRLFSCKEPNFGPKGRPTFVILSEKELNQGFKY